MAAFRSSEAGYGDGEPNDTAGWHEIDISRLQPPDGTLIPFKLYATGSRAARRTQAFSTIRSRTWSPGRGGRGRLAGNLVRGQPPPTLSRIHLYALAVVAPDEKTVAVTYYKQPPAG